MARSFVKTTYPDLVALESATLANTKIQLSANPCDILYCNIENPDATNKAYVQFFDAIATNVTVGTTKPKRSIVIPAGSTWDGLFTVPMSFGTALTIAATTTREGAVAPVTSLIVGCIDYLG